MTFRLLRYSLTLWFRTPYLPSKAGSSPAQFGAGERWSDFFDPWPGSCSNIDWWTFVEFFDIYEFSLHLDLIDTFFHFWNRTPLNLVPSTRNLKFCKGSIKNHPEFPHIFSTSCGPKADRMLLLDLPRGEMESEEETATSGSSSVFVWRGGAVFFLFLAGVWKAMEELVLFLFFKGFREKEWHGDFFLPDTLVGWRWKWFRMVTVQIPHSQYSTFMWELHG